MSKRERQKQRREAKLVQQRAAQARARRTRLLTFAVLGVVVAGAVGAFACGKYREDQLEEQRRADVLAKLDELGCTEVQDLPDQGAGHFSGEELAATPPDVAYQDRPA